MIATIATLGPLGRPISGLAFIIGVVRIIDMGRTVVKVLGIAIAAVAISKRDGTFRKPETQRTTADAKAEKTDRSEETPDVYDAASLGGSASMSG